LAFVDDQHLISPIGRDRLGDDALLDSNPEFRLTDPVVVEPLTSSL
jgi:hypothetical protein